MKKLLLSLLVAFSGMAMNAQTLCLVATPITASGTFVCPAITGTYPTTGLCFTTANTAPKAIWYKFTPTANGLISVDAAIAPNSPETNDTRLSILRGTCTALTCVTANDDAANDDYRSKVSNVAVTAGTTYYIVWDNNWTSTGFSFNFNFTPATCFAPSGPYSYTVAPTTTTASLGWTAPTIGTPTGYDFQYGPVGFTLGTGTILPTTTNSIALTSLTPSTAYEFYVRTNCGTTNGYSTWAGPVSFTTVFQAADVPYSTSFEAAQFFHIGWAETSATTYTGNDWQTNAGLAQTGSTSAVVVASAVTTNAWLLSRGISLTANLPVTITYYVRNFLQAPSTGSGSYELKAGIAQTIAGMTIPVAASETISDATYVQKTVSFTPTATGTYYLGFHATSPINAGVQALVLDDVVVTQPLGVKDFSANRFSVYPNPSNSLVTINNTLNALINNVQITDLNGRVVKTNNYASSTEIQVNISDLSAGVYMMSINSDQGSVTKKIVKN